MTGELFREEKAEDEILENNFDIRRLFWAEMEKHPFDGGLKVCIKFAALHRLEEAGKVRHSFAMTGLIV